MDTRFTGDGCDSRASLAGREVSPGPIVSFPHASVKQWQPDGRSNGLCRYGQACFAEPAEARQLALPIWITTR